MNRGLLLLGVQLVAFWPVGRWYIARMSDGSDEPWGVLALLTAAFFVMRECYEQRAVTKERSAWPLYFSLLLVAVYAISFSSVPPLVRAAIAVTALALTISHVCLSRSVHVGVLGLLVLSLPIIASLQFYLGYPIRLLTALFAAKLISLTGYPVDASGTSLLWFGEVVSVDAPCSGIKMLWTGLYLNFTLACLFRLDSLATWISYSLASVAIFLGNVLRSSVLFYAEAGIFAAPSWFHQSVGLVVFAAVAITIFKLQLYLQQRPVCDVSN